MVLIAYQDTEKICYRCTGLSCTADGSTRLPITVYFGVPTSSPGRLPLARRATTSQLGFDRYNYNLPLRKIGHYITATTEFGSLPVYIFI